MFYKGHKIFTFFYISQRLFYHYLLRKRELASMKLLISFSFIIILCVLMNGLTSVPVNAANELIVTIKRELADYTLCRLWVTDENLNYIAGNTNNKECDSDDAVFQLPSGTSKYFIFAHVPGSFEEDKKRGPYNGNSCLSIHGSLDVWKFNDIPSFNCYH
ncbi:hypothetical protein C1646_666912 [Rhizophagus diaphanus]|nr:hypothetical protein C1646_666912 [Rhizophagus diaphanus] [Rhizophagus sp. MUCL 43196]